jgi:hypothetical protein
MTESAAGYLCRTSSLSARCRASASFRPTLSSSSRSSAHTSRSCRRRRRVLKRSRISTPVAGAKSSATLAPSSAPIAKPSDAAASTGQPFPSERELSRSVRVIRDVCREAGRVAVSVKLLELRYITMAVCSPWPRNVRSPLYVFMRCWSKGYASRSCNYLVRNLLRQGLQYLCEELNEPVW